MKFPETIRATVTALQEGRVTQLQYEALELFISRSLKATVRAKKVILWFLRQSNFLQRDIAMTIPYMEFGKNDDYEFALEVANAVHDMGNMMYGIFNLMGFAKNLKHHGGVATKVGPQLITFDTEDHRGYTIWLAPEFYSRNVELLEFDLEAIWNTKLRSSYFHISSSDTSSEDVKCLDPEFYEDDKIPEEQWKVGVRFRP